MTDIVGFLTSILALLGLFLMIYGIVKQQSDVKRRMIEKGMNPKDAEGRKFGGGALKFGGLLIGVGLGLFLAKMLEMSLQIADSEAIYFGLVAIFGGIGLVIAHNIARKQFREDQDLY